MSDGIVPRLQRLFHAGRRLQADSDRHDGSWLRGVYVPSVVVATFLAFPVHVVVFVALDSVMASDTANTIALVPFLGLVWIAYLVHLGTRHERFAE